MEENNLQRALRLLDFCSDIQDRDSILQNVDLASSLLRDDDKRGLCWHCDGDHPTQKCPSAVTKRFVVGFAFDANEHRVVLIKKDHPKWLEGKFNGLGGKVEPGESSHQAMRREFLEEAGVDTGDVWTHFASIVDQRDWAIDFFYTHLSDNQFAMLVSKTSEQVRGFYIEEPNFPVLAELILPTIEQGLLPNLSWLIPMALSMKHEVEHWEGSTRMQVNSFKITEHGNCLEN